MEKKTSKPKKMCSTKHRTKDMMKFPFKSAGKKKRRWTPLHCELVPVNEFAKWQFPALRHHHLELPLPGLIGFYG
jgi:hypothetical protein